MTRNAITFQNVSKTYPLPHSPEHKVKALKDVSFNIEEGSFFGLLGVNGAGKSTLIHLLSGISKLEEGKIKVLGHDVLESPHKTKRLLGVVPQDVYSDNFFPIGLALSFQAKIAGVKPDKDWMHYLLDTLKLYDHRYKTSAELSGGMQRRVMIARALVHKPQILVLDEPTAGVDVNLRHGMWEFIHALHKTGMTIILTTHYLEEAEKFCEKIAIIKQGELLTLKTKEDLLNIGQKPSVVFYLEVPKEPRFVVPTNLVLEHNEAEASFRLSKTYEAHDPHSLKEALDTLHAFSEEKGLKVLRILTKNPSLEDIFIDLNR
jgi:ABC-2 type transport system ATP-binding protein